MTFHTYARRSWDVSVPTANGDRIPFLRIYTDTEQKALTTYRVIAIAYADRHRRQG